MKKYLVRIKEAFVCYVEVDAESKSAAYDIVNRQVEDCEIVVPRDYGDMERNISVVRVVKG